MTQPLGSRSVNWPRVVTGGLPLDLVDRDQALEVITHYAKGNASGALALVSSNLDHIHQFRFDRTWLARSPATLSRRKPDSDAFSLDWMTLIDGFPVARIAHRMTGIAWPRLAGSDLIDPVLDLAAKHRWTIGFLGGTTETHQALQTSMATRHADVPVSGYWAPDRKELSDTTAMSRLVTEIAESGTKILVVGLGKPRQEQWIAKYGLQTDARVLLAFGAVVDFLAGRVKRAPRWVADSGMEWAWRLSKEPRRLARRYLIQGPQAYMRLRTHSGGVPASVGQNCLRTPPARETHVPQELHHLAGPTQRAEVTALITSSNSPEGMERLIRSLRKEAGTTNIRLIVCSDISQVPNARALASCRDVTIVDTSNPNRKFDDILDKISDSEALLFVQPDTELGEGSVRSMLSRLPRTGAVVPLVIAGDGKIVPTIRREPSIIRAATDAILGEHFPGRPTWLSETERRMNTYDIPRTVDWARVPAVLVDRNLAHLLSDSSGMVPYALDAAFFRRLRDAGRVVWFEPTAKVRLRNGGHETFRRDYPAMTANQASYAEAYMSRFRAQLFRFVLILNECLRSRDPMHRRTAAVLIDRQAWSQGSGSGYSSRLPAEGRHLPTGTLRGTD